MQEGVTLPALAAEIQRVSEAKRDYVAPARLLRMEPLRPALGADGPRQVCLRIGEQAPVGVSDLAHGQMASWAKVPKPYYDRMRTDAPELLAANVNTWLERSDDRRMVRTLWRRARAFLSDRYRPLDNALVAEATLPVLMQDHQMRVQSCALTERRLYIQAVTERLSAEVVVGDVVQAGLMVSNSEVGCGAVRVEPLVYRLVCANGMITSHTIRKYHVGKRIGGNGEEVRADFYQDETRRADDRAFLLKLRDTVRHALSEEGFQSEVDKLRATTERALPPSRAPDVVKDITKQLQLTEGEGDAVLDCGEQAGEAKGATMC